MWRGVLAMQLVYKRCWVWAGLTAAGANKCIGNIILDMNTNFRVYVSHVNGI